MHGELKVGIRTDALVIESCWRGLTNPELDAERVEGGVEGVRNHPSERMKGVEGEDGWAVVRVEGRDWGRVLGVGRLGGRVIACEWFFLGGHSLFFVSLLCFVVFCFVFFGLCGWALDEMDLFSLFHSAFLGGDSMRYSCFFLVFSVPLPPSHSLPQLFRI